MDDTSFPNDNPTREIRRHIASPRLRQSYQRVRPQPQIDGDSIQESDKEAEKKDKKRRRKKKERKPNILGGGLAIFSIVIVFLLLNSFSQDSESQVEGLQTQQKSDKQAAKAMQRLQSNAQKTLNSLKKQSENVNVLDVTTQSQQVEKLENDLEAVKSLPQEISQTLSKQGNEAVENALQPIFRLQKIIQDAVGVKDVILEKIKEL